MAAILSHKKGALGLAAHVVRKRMAPSCIEDHYSCPRPLQVIHRRRASTRTVEGSLDVLSRYLMKHTLMLQHEVLSHIPDSFLVSTFRLSNV